MAIINKAPPNIFVQVFLRAHTFISLEYGEVEPMNYTLRYCLLLFVIYLLLFVIYLLLYIIYKIYSLYIFVIIPISNRKFSPVWSYHYPPILGIVNAIFSLSGVWGNKATVVFALHVPVVYIKHFLICLLGILSPSSWHVSSNLLFLFELGCSFYCWVLWTLHILRTCQCSGECFASIFCHPAG